MNLHTATKRELKDYAFEELGLNIGMNIAESVMIDRILQACKEQGITPPENRIGHNPEAGTKAAENSTRKPLEYVTVNIGKQAGAGGSEPVFLGVQGKGILVPRGRNIKIPYPYAVCLENAKQDILTDDGEGGLNKEVVYQYPFQIVLGRLKPEHQSNQVY